MSLSGNSSIQNQYILTLLHALLNKKADMNRFTYIYKNWMMNLKGVQQPLPTPASPLPFMYYSSFLATQ